MGLAHSANMAHEIAHNMGVPHPSACRTDSYMHRCMIWGNWWTNAGDFKKALAHRLEHDVPDTTDASGAASGVAAQAGKGLLIWGTVESGRLHLNPAFEVEARPRLPERKGSYEITGMDASGRSLFSLSFDPAQIEDGDGGATFAFVVPFDRAAQGALARIVLVGKEGRAELLPGSNPPMALLRNPVTGQVRGFVPNWSEARAASVSAAGLSVSVSRGIPR